MLDIREKRKYADGSVVYFMYQGHNKNNDTDNSEAKDRIKDFLNRPYLCRKIKRSISILRTILKDYDENYLFLRYVDNEVDKSIQYQNYELVSFEKKYKKSNNSIKYNQRKNVHFDMKDKNSMEKTEFDAISKNFNDLRNIGPFEINDDCKKIIMVYRLFFGVNPSFNENTISDRIQCMMYLLKEYGIVFPEFSELIDSNGLPISIHLERLVYRMFPFGSINDKFDENLLDEKQKKVIKMVGKNVCSAIQFYRDITEAMIAICKMMEEEKQGKKKDKLDIEEERIKENIKTLRKIKVNMEEK